MSTPARVAYHEAAHALIALAFGRKVDTVSASFVGGSVLEEQFAPNGSEEEIRRSLVVTFAGEEGERYAPADTGGAPAEWNGGLSVGQLEALASVQRNRENALPSDEEVVAHYSERIGAEAVEECRRLAVELVARKAAIGTLQRLADELMWRGTIDGDDLERLLASA